MEALTAIILFCKISWKVHPNIQEKFERICIENIQTCRGKNLTNDKAENCILQYVNTAGKYEEN